MARRTVEEKLAFITEWSKVAGRTSQRQFCLANSIAPGTFNKWVKNADRLRATSSHKKNAQRTPLYVDETRRLHTHLDECLQQNMIVTVIDLLAFCRKNGILSSTGAYINRYMFCRRVLLAYSLKHPSTTTGVPRMDLLLEAVEIHMTTAADPTALLVANGDHNVQMITEMVFTDALPRQRRVNYGRCQCTNECQPEEGCINRALAEDCDTLNCSSAGKCTNRWKGNTLENILEVFQTRRTGLGLRARVVIPSGSVVVEYIGEYLRYTTYQERCKAGTAPTSTYFMECDDKYGVDARNMGNVARFINHACDPNLVPMKRVVGVSTRVFLVASTDIAAWEELTFSYTKATSFACACKMHTT